MIEKSVIWSRWSDHLENCKICLKAIRVRFIHIPNANELIHERCCDIGKPLYKAFINENEKDDWLREEYDLSQLKRVPRK